MAHALRALLVVVLISSSGMAEPLSERVGRENALTSIQSHLGKMNLETCEDRLLQTYTDALISYYVHIEIETTMNLIDLDMHQGGESAKLVRAALCAALEMRIDRKAAIIKSISEHAGACTNAAILVHVNKFLTTAGLLLGRDRVLFDELTDKDFNTTWCADDVSR